MGAPLLRFVLGGSGIKDFILRLPCFYLDLAHALFANVADLDVNPSSEEHINPHLKARHRLGICTILGAILRTYFLILHEGVTWPFDLDELRHRIRDIPDKKIWDARRPMRIVFTNYSTYKGK